LTVRHSTRCASGILVTCTIYYKNVTVHTIHYISVELWKCHCGLVVKVPGYRWRGPGWCCNLGLLQFPVRPDFLRSSGSATGSTQSCEYNWRATWKKKVAAPV
jgi:hypothetical protein